MIKALIAIRDRLITDPRLTEVPIYPQHITAVDNPVFPAITLSIPDNSSAPEMAGQSGQIQIDVWERYRSEEIQSGYDGLWRWYAAIRDDLDLVTLTGDFNYFCVETYCNDQGYEQDTRVYHLASRYRVEIIPETYDVDDWVAALAIWAKVRLPGWNVTGASWPQTIARPCCVVRLAHFTVGQEGSGMLRLNKSINFHLFGQTVNQQQQAAAALALQAQLDYKIPVDAGGRQYMTLSGNPEVATDIDPSSTGGQVTFQVHQICWRPQLPESKLRRIHINGGSSGKGKHSK